MLFADAVAGFMRHLEARGRSRNTQRTYTIALRKLGRYLEEQRGGEPEVHEISADDLDAYLYWLMDQGLSARSRRHLTYTVRSFFRFCGRVRAVEANPAEDLVLASAPRRLPTYLDSSEVKLFLDRACDPLVKVIAGVLFYTGVRVGELCGLRLSDVDLRRGTLKVMGKGSKERVVPLNERCRDLLLRYLVNLRPQTSSDSFFITRRGRPLDRGWAAILLQREVRRQGWKERITPHVFRHSCASALCERGVSVAVIAELLGHSSVTTTMLYVHLNAESLRQAVERLA